MKARRIYRVTGFFPDQTTPDGEWGADLIQVVRYYHSKSGAQRRKRAWFTEVHEPGGYDHLNGFEDDYFRPAALSVSIVESDPITFPGGTP